jgi:hypothetical protein
LDDGQLYGFYTLSTVDQRQSRVSSCVDDTANWMHTNRLQQSALKTKIFWYTTGRWQQQLSVPVDIDFIVPSSPFRDQGIYLDADVSTTTHIKQTASECFGALCQLLGSIRQS